MGALVFLPVRSFSATATRFGKVLDRIDFGGTETELGQDIAEFAIFQFAQGWPDIMGAERRGRYPAMKRSSRTLMRRLMAS